MFEALDNELQQHCFRKIDSGFLFTMDKRTKMTVL